MTEVSDVLDNVFTEPVLQPVPVKNGNMAEDCRKRFQLLDYSDVMTLSDVMETSVPIDGKGNFPSLEVSPSKLVQMVRDGLSKEGIIVPSVRLNGSAATHVLSGDAKHPYKDLDLIFTVDVSTYEDWGGNPKDLNINLNNNNTYCRTKGHRVSSRRQSSCTASKGRVELTSNSPEESSKIQSSFVEQRKTLPLTTVGEKLESTIPGSTATATATATAVLKTVAAEDDDGEDKDSGYTSSGSSVTSTPHSPVGSWVHQNQRSRSHSESASSATFLQGGRCKDGHHLGVRSRPSQKSVTKERKDLCGRSKESCWQKIKEVVMTILRDLLPVGVVSSRMTDAMLTDAYVQKMVKISNEVDRWSLISLNNDAGRNLELKFVENMRRQYEFSVDSFQIILDSYQRFKIVSGSLENEDGIKLSPRFFPSVLAESVYGDFHAALRHLRHRRICTRRPEEIRGGGLLRYCNLRVRDFTLGDVEGHKDSAVDDGTGENVTTPTSEASDVTSRSSTEDVNRLEQLMCSRFFIDFNDFSCQQRKVMNYLESHFQSDDDVKFQYLLIVRRVVERGTICLMTNERSQIVEFIKKLALDTLSKIVKGQTTQVTPSCLPPYSQLYIPLHFPPQPLVCPHEIHQNNPNDCCYYHPQLMSPSNYAPSVVYPQCQHPPPPNADPSYFQIAPGNVSFALCPCCKSTFSYSDDTPSAPPVTVTPQQHTMSVDSPPFYPRTPRPVSGVPKSSPIKANGFRIPVVYLDKDSTLIYSADLNPV